MTFSRIINQGEREAGTFSQNLACEEKLASNFAAGLDQNHNSFLTQVRKACCKKIVFFSICLVLENCLLNFYLPLYKSLIWVGLVWFGLVWFGFKGKEQKNILLLKGSN